jgi:hypothetical protein
LGGDKEDKKSLGSLVRSEIKDNETSKETMPRSISDSKEEKERVRDDDGQRN